MKRLTIGSDARCDLVLEGSTVSDHHAHLEIDAEGHLALTDAGSRHGTHLGRAGTWVRARRIVLCAGDRVRFGDTEVSLDTLVGALGRGARQRLLRDRRAFTPLLVGRHGFGPDRPGGPRRPRRNPLTGAIEDDS